MTANIGAGVDGVGYTVFEAVGGCYWVRRKRALVGAKSVLANEMQGDCFLGRGHPVGVGYARFQAMGGGAIG